MVLFLPIVDNDFLDKNSIKFHSHILYIHSGITWFCGWIGEKMDKSEDEGKSLAYTPNSVPSDRLQCEVLHAEYQHQYRLLGQRLVR